MKQVEHESAILDHLHACEIVLKKPSYKSVCQLLLFFLSVPTISIGNTDNSESPKKKS